MRCHLEMRSWSDLEEQVKSIKKGFILVLLRDLSLLPFRVDEGIPISLTRQDLKFNRCLEGSILILTVDCIDKNAWAWKKVGDSLEKRPEDFSFVKRMLESFAHPSLNEAGRSIKLEEVLCGAEHH